MQPLMYPNPLFTHCLMHRLEFIELGKLKFNRLNDAGHYQQSVSSLYETEVNWERNPNFMHNRIMFR